jgi:hypothetical protein
MNNMGMNNMQGNMAMNNSDCGCDGSSPNVDVLNRNLGVGNNQNMPMNNNNQNIGAGQVKLINNLAQNQNQINNNSHLNHLIAPVQNLEVLQDHNNKVKENNNKFCKKEVRFFLYILLALAINEMFKFFINQGIRLNKASSNRYLFYPLGILVILVIVCFC